MTINDANLRCIISIGGSGKVPHLLVSNVVENSSKVCMVIRFPAELQTDLESHNKRLQDKNSKNKMTAAQEKEALQGFDMVRQKISNLIVSKDAMVDLTA